MGWATALIGMGLFGAVAYWMGVRAERARCVRWTRIQEAIRGDRRRRGGITLRRLTIRR